jgi:XTP/dITP diphosphohydrolase
VSQTHRLVVASLNRAKAREIARILREEGLGLQVVSLADFPGANLPEECGASFAENAVAKAEHAARATELPAVADDSGLEVEALGGEPGILSARYVGKGASDAERCRKVLDLMREVPEGRRQARFRCAAAFATPEGEVLVADGTCEGRIVREPAGGGGFGYDPIFVPDGYGVTMAELTPEQKDGISHRGRALRELAKMMRAWLLGGGSR